MSRYAHVSKKPFFIDKLEACWIVGAHCFTPGRFERMGQQGQKSESQTGNAEYGWASGLSKVADVVWKGVLLSRITFQGLLVRIGIIISFK